MTRDQALAIVDAICFGPAENRIITPLLEQLQRAFPHARFLDLIYHQPTELTPEQIVDEALQREANVARSKS